MGGLNRDFTHVPHLRDVSSFLRVKQVFNAKYKMVFVSVSLYNVITHVNYER